MAPTEIFRPVVGISDVHSSQDGTSFRLEGAVYPELYPVMETGRYEVNGESVVCVSSQKGCRMGCIFCKSAEAFMGNLRAAEIVTQAIWAIDRIPPASDSLGIVFSFMGMGEPFANIDNVKIAIKILGQAYPHSRATLSTIGFDLPAIRRLADEVAAGEYPIPVKLHVSLHGSSDKQRFGIVPSAKPLIDTLDAAEYFASTTGTDVKLNYVLVAGSNASPEDAGRLGQLLKSRKELILKISQLNSPDKSLVVPEAEADEFERIVNSYGVDTCRFVSQGQDISARCGEFVISVFSRFSRTLLGGESLIGC